MTDPVISVQYIKKRYGEHLVLDGLSFHVERGSIFALLGENGAGKTTMVRILATLIKADSGSAKIGGYDTDSESVSVKKLISLTGQYAAVDELLTGEENLQMIGQLNHLDHRTVKARTVELLEQFDLSGAAKKRVSTYSGGMRRRLDIAISLFANPEVIFLDEPTTGLDPRSRKNMWELIRKLADRGVTIFLTTQYLEEADQLADKIAVMNNGKIIETGTSEQLKSIIGKEKLELTFQDQASFDEASKVIKGQINESEKLISVETEGSTEILRRLLNTLHENQIEPVAMHFRKPTLDDVFLEITGKSAKGASSND
ncbi:daunorubicin resistance protein DrrA family ABC transporter ATP-binding protein [Geomicrobium sp. JCM 19038]|uniref:daunorubicin resistance protein DrrA family ABC transporter ATP-binding protein n=1 Tax=Geomicrobium sp. JCM 19038 TaxID=1460635 RepID=UPI00045F32BA|nr:daunorubicin resistance protein DrrA family ABC transporter ATP-binding protein [Geomicrobium sp. JCM 19038]GAK09181.1 putative ABC transporter, ATP-binding protein [Geomicrobium sp. JCM 19038]